MYTSTQCSIHPEQEKMLKTCALIHFRSLRTEVKGMPVLRFVANKALDALNKQRLLSLTSVQYQQHAQTTDTASKRKQHGFLAPSAASSIPGESVRSISLSTVRFNLYLARSSLNIYCEWDVCVNFP